MVEVLIKKTPPDDAGRFSYVAEWIRLPLAQALSIEVAAHSVVGRFVTTRERVIVSRPFVQPALFLCSAARANQGAYKKDYCIINKRRHSRAFNFSSISN
jgi:hypothetical protein